MPPVNGVGEPCAGEPHARFDAAGAGNGVPGHGHAAKRPAGETRGKVAARPHAGKRHRASPRPYHCYGSRLSCRSSDATVYVDWHVCTRSGRETHLKRHPSRPLSRGSTTSMSGWRDSNPRPRAPKARALAKLRYSPSCPSITGMSATLLLQREVAGDHKPMPATPLSCVAARASSKCSGSLVRTTQSVGHGSLCHVPKDGCDGIRGGGVLLV